MQHGNNMRPRNDNYNNNRNNSAGRPNNGNEGRNGNMNMQMGMPAPASAMTQGPPMGQNQGPDQAFYNLTLKLIPSIVPANPHMKQQVGNAIFDFVTKLKGNTFAPKITGMLIDLPHEEIKAFLQNYGEFMKKVNDAGNLLQVQAGQAPPTMAPPSMMQAPPMAAPMQAPGQTPMPPQQN